MQHIRGDTMLNLKDVHSLSFRTYENDGEPCTDKNFIDSYKIRVSGMSRDEALTFRDLLYKTSDCQISYVRILLDNNCSI